MLGVVLFWFGVLVGVYMHTSFMHPPFGFALFYLRIVAPSKDYTDRITKKLLAPVTTMEIYWGAVPFVIIQIVMVGLIIAFPQLVSGGLGKVEKLDLDKAKQELQLEYQQEQDQLNATPAAPGASGTEAMPNPAEEQKSEQEQDKEISDLFKQKK